jgi:hypothetical protein
MSYNNLKEALEKYAKAYTIKIKSQLRKDKTNVSGDLVNSIRPDLSLENQFSILALDYIEQVSEGRSAGKMPSWPPKENRILEWIKKKPIIPKKKGKVVSSSPNNLKSLAYVIARSIGRRGTIKRFGYKGSNIIDFVYNSLSKQMGDEIFEAYKIDLEKILKEQVK